jgi:hypothetical protein
MTWANAKIKRIYVGTKVVWPWEITETYTWTASVTSIAKSWYKIKQLIWEMSATNSSNDYAWLFLNKIRLQWSYDYWVVLHTWNQRWNIWQYWSVMSDYQSSGGSIRWLSFPSSATTRSAWACRVTVTATTTKVEVWQTFGNRLYTNTYNHTSNENTYVQTIFNANDQSISWLYGSSAVIWTNRVIVTRIPA